MEEVIRLKLRPGGKQQMVQLTTAIKLGAVSSYISTPLDGSVRNGRSMLIVKTGATSFQGAYAPQ